MRISAQEAVEELYQQSLALGVNAIINLKIESLIDLGKDLRSRI